MFSRDNYRHHLDDKRKKLLSKVFLPPDARLEPFKSQNIIKASQSFYHPEKLAPQQVDTFRNENFNENTRNHLPCLSFILFYDFVPLPMLFYFMFISPQSSLQQKPKKCEGRITPGCGNQRYSRFLKPGHELIMQAQLKLEPMFGIEPWCLEGNYLWAWHGFGALGSNPSSAEQNKLELKTLA